MRLPIFVAGIIAAVAPASAIAATPVELHATFIPYRLGASTTVRFGFDVGRPGETPPPITSINLHLPAGMNENASQLGLDTCQPATLATVGAKGCPTNSQLGFGSAGVEVTFGTTPIRETEHVTTFAGPAKSPSEILYDVEGQAPIISDLVYPGQAREEPGVFSGAIETVIPLIPTAPGGNYVATTSFESTLGPLGITYYRHTSGRAIPFHPQGIVIPRKCPAGGFPFLVQLRFANGTAAASRTSVSCPRRHKGRT